MKQNKRIVITGGIATGKSTASAYLRELGYPVIDADVIARSMIKKGAPAYQKVIDTFGEGVVQSDGEIDRKALGAIVFPSEEERMRLNAIVHPLVQDRIQEALTELSGEPLVFLDIPLYYETKGLGAYPVWLIYAPKETQLSRLMKRDGITEEEAMHRITAQMDIEDKRARADRVIPNTSDRSAMHRALQKAVRETAGE